jgi:hypothetical protein
MKNNKKTPPNFIEFIHLMDKIFLYYIITQKIFRRFLKKSYIFLKKRVYLES